MKNINRHFPPVRHKWASSARRASATIGRYISRHSSSIDPLLELHHLADDLGGKILSSKRGQSISNMSNAKSVVVVSSPVVHVHRGQNSLAFEILAKRPISPILTIEDFRKDVAAQLALAALQHR